MKYVLGGLTILHILAKLFTHWFVELKTLAQYIPVPIHRATHLKVHLKYVDRKQTATSPLRIVLSQAYEVIAAQTWEL